MNDILQLKGRFKQQSGSAGGGVPSIPKQTPQLGSTHLTTLSEDLVSIRDWWSRRSLIRGILLDAHHNRVMAKSNRIGNAFMKGEKTANESIVGARFATDDNQGKKHVITYYIDNETISDMIDKLQLCARLIDDRFNGYINNEKLKNFSTKEIDPATDGINLTTLRQIVVNSAYLDRFDIPDNGDQIKDQSIITIYKTDIGISEVLKRVGIEIATGHIMSSTTALLNWPQIMTLRQKAPYLIAMATENMTQLNPDGVIGGSTVETSRTIADPGNEPVVGVIDTMFDSRVYFSRWVEFNKMIGDDIPVNQSDYNHGTAVSSIIVDGPAMNPDLDDGCGRFRVRHFGVAAGERYSSFEIINNIRLIVEGNPDIKVWNLSLGSNNETNLNSISPEAATLDEIQHNHDVIFVVAGTNKSQQETDKRVGSPADSINSIVVNSVNGQSQPASYSRRGPVLSFFTKPDVSSQGGDKASGDFIRVCMPTGETQKDGTSFAAPWITRKLAYLVEVLGLSREVAKALIIDAATGWEDKANQPSASLIGYGAVPIRVEDVIQTPNEEIKFVIGDVSEKYDTFTYNLPVPIHNNKYPFIAKATLCYFPKCSISQGVDYTDTEIDIYLGRIVKDDETGNPRIKSINKNTQSVAGPGIHERDARSNYRKWDNTKHICELYSNKVRPRKLLKKGNRMWGISLKTKERLAGRVGAGIKFGLVITLKEITGANRIDDFIRQCSFHGWLVSRIDIESRIRLHNKIQEDIRFSPAKKE